MFEIVAKARISASRRSSAVSRSSGSRAVRYLDRPVQPVEHIVEPLGFGKALPVASIEASSAPRSIAFYALELFRAVADLDTVYVPVGLGSGICGVIAARDALGLTTEVVGVVAENAPTYALSVAAGRPVPTNRADTLAEGIAVRVPDPGGAGHNHEGRGADRHGVGAELRLAARVMFSDTRNLAEGAGAAALAAAIQERGRLAGKRVAVVQSGGNIERALMAEVLAEGDAG